MLLGVTYFRIAQNAWRIASNQSIQIHNPKSEIHTPQSEIHRHHLFRKIFIIRPKKAVNITRAAKRPMGITTSTLNFNTNISKGMRMNRIVPIKTRARHPVRKSLLNLYSSLYSSGPSIFSIASHPGQILCSRRNHTTILW